MLKFIKHPTILLHDAARSGNVEFLILLIQTYPNIAWEDDEDGKNIFHVAVENRLENVFSLIHEISGLKHFSAKYRTTGKEKYNMLHLAAKLAAPNHLNRVSGAALQMQRELLWFKEVEKIVLPSQREAKCEVDSLIKLTPCELFTKEHKDLRKDGEEWMKNTANSCMLVSTLIATVVFAAAFTVPGGNDGNSGTPIFQHEFWFTIFVISDAFALVSSSTSILMFLSILTSRYAEDDFLHLLPSKLLVGIASLFISIVCMVIAFSATFFMLYNEANIWIPTTVTAIAIVPISCFCALHFGLWIDTFHNTYLSRFLFRPHQRKLFSSSASHAVDLFRELKKRRNPLCCNGIKCGGDGGCCSIASFYKNFPMDLMGMSSTAIEIQICHCRSSSQGEWEYVELLLDGSPEYVRCAITRNKETVLHIAAGAKQTEFVEKLVDRMNNDDMILQNKYGNTALCFAAASGVVRIAQLMVEKNEDLPLVRGFNNAITPLFITVSYKCTEMVS
ncbi:unnamed protein product [Citrullus colocynthis]|uniref:PGG domain-containing protein n=1 Tax=Citrullus colocynthis TaxID=252529 RepID=A0ABP0Z3C6_9ROSI